MDIPAIKKDSGFFFVIAIETENPCPRGWGARYFSKEMTTRRSGPTPSLPEDTCLKLDSAM